MGFFENKQYRDFQLTEHGFRYKNNDYSINQIHNIFFNRTLTIQNGNFFKIGEAESAVLILIMGGGKKIKLSFDEDGMIIPGLNFNKKNDIKFLIDLYLHFSKNTFDRRLKQYTDQIAQIGYFIYDKSHFYPKNKIVIKGKEFSLKTSTFHKSYGHVEARRQDYGMINKVMKELIGTSSQFETETDTDVIFYILDKYFNLSWA